MTITVGRPLLSYGRGCVTAVTLSYLSDGRRHSNERVVVWKGEHPTILLHESEISIALHYTSAQGDLMSCLKECVEGEVQSLLDRFPITVEPGERYDISYFRLKVTPSVPIPGLQIPKAIVHTDWFK